MATFQEIWLQLQQPGDPLPLVMINCAAMDGGEGEIPKHIFSEFQSLFAGDLAEELADVGPYLGWLGATDGKTLKIVEDLLKSHAATLVLLEPASEDALASSFSAILRHFRKFNVVYGPDGKPMFFRYYDPRVIYEVLSVMEPGQLERFFGPARAFVIAAEDASIHVLER